MKQDLKRKLALQKQGLNAGNVADVMEALGSGDTAMTDVHMEDGNGKHALQTMHDAARSSKDDEGSQLQVEDTQPRFEDSQLPMEMQSTIAEAGEDDEAIPRLVDSDSDDDEEPYEYAEAYGKQHMDEVAGEWEVKEPPKKKRKMQSKLETLQALVNSQSNSQS